MNGSATRTTGAWLIAHSLKLQKVDTEGQFSSMEAAGKFGRVLSIVSANDEQTLPINLRAVRCDVERPMGCLEGEKPFCGCGLFAHAR